MTTSIPHSRILVRFNHTPVVDSLVPAAHSNESVTPSNLITVVVVVIVAFVGLCTIVAVRHSISRLHHPSCSESRLDLVLLGQVLYASGRRQASSSSLLDPPVGSMEHGTKVDERTRNANRLFRRVLFVLGLSVPSLGAFLKRRPIHAASRRRSVHAFMSFTNDSLVSLSHRWFSRTSTWRSSSWYTVFLFHPCNFLSCVSNLCNVGAAL